MVSAQSLDAPLVAVEFGEDDTIRGLVQEYLSDPDLWPRVLELNNLSSPAEVVPGTVLLMPVQQVQVADAALLASLQAIQQATAEGARIFAPTEIGNAIDNRDQAIASRVDGEWREVVDFAELSTGFANEALEISVAQRDRSAEAVVSDVHGEVEGRSPEEQRWSDRTLNDVLVEFERVRTLSDSTTQITFRDLSRLRLNANSNATIQRMRSDPLTGGEVTKVSLVNGDFYALLNQLTDKTQFEIEVPGIESTTNSADFWIKSDQTGARFVNYDAEELEISQGGEVISLGENEGVVIDDGTTQLAAVLDRPTLAVPQPDAILYGGVVDLNWRAFDGAEGYWLEVASDPGFNVMVTSQWGLRDTAFTLTDLGPGTYHWRVSALDRLGLPGEWSASQPFEMRIDNTPPFLTLLSPRDGVIVTAPQIEVLGASEADAVLTLNGAEQPVGGDGSFLTSVPLVVGENVISVVATDAAGNQSERSRTVIYRPVAALELTLSPDLDRDGDVLVTRSEELSVIAATTAQPGAPVEVVDDTGTVAVQTVVGEGGRITFTAPAEEALRRYVIRILAPTGDVEGSLAFEVLRDQTAPEVGFDLPPPRATIDEVIEVSGQVTGATALTLNGEPAELGADGRFALEILLEPGPNTFDLVSSDPAGNVTLTRIQTLYDIEPPRILLAEARRPQGNNGPIEVIVEAEDESGLRQAAPFILAIDGVETEGFMRCDAATGICRASLPPEPGRLELVEVIVEDYAGNEAFQ